MHMVSLMEKEMERNVSMTLKQNTQDRLIQHASRLRFPKLLVLTTVVFVIDLIFPDALPCADEILLGLVTLLLAILQKRDLKSE
jgi:hypothetical protein